MTPIRKIIIIVGTRPEAIKLLPVYLAFKKTHDFTPYLVSTGQHKEMLASVFSLFSVIPDVDLCLMMHNQNLSDITSLLFEHLQKTIQDLRPDLIIVQGDTSSAMVGSMVGFYNQVKVAHIEAGLRTYDKYSPFPEEVNRQIIGLVADVHFAPTEVAKNTLQKEGKNEIYMVGNTIIDSLLWVSARVESQKKELHKQYTSVFDPTRPLVLVTGHRRENLGVGFNNICNALIVLAQKYADIQFVYPVHLNPNVQKIVYEKLGGILNIKLIDQVPYNELVYLMKQAIIIITDSGGIQEEAPSLDKPILVTRTATERPEGISNGCAILVGTKQENIVNKFVEIYENPSLYQAMAKAKNPYGNGDASAKIVSIIKTIFAR